MAPCKYCMNLDIPSFEAVARSRKQRTYNGSHTGIAKPEGLKPHINITIQELAQGVAATGCETCIMLRNVLALVFGDALESVSEIECMGSARNTLKVTASTKEGFTDFELYTHIDSPSPWPIIGAARGVSLDSSSDECIDLASSWIRECIDNHRNCHHIECTPLPTRVIDVGSDNVEPRLYVSKQEKAKYITLSHCWGGKIPITTTLATVEERQREIKFWELPKTFRDAISITRKLNIQYIWIDSLCIIQDSEDDWTREAASMAGVYRNGFVCIAADGAVDSSEGCFIGGLRRNFDIGYVECPGTGERTSAVYIREKPNTMAGGFAHFGHLSEYYGSKLDTRGWVLQEQALSLRTLHYTVSELAWDCATHIRCECAIPPEKVETLENIMQLRACKRMMGLELQEYSRWTNLVELFTQRSLTYETDRLHALSGIASSIRWPSDKFLAGLWDEELPVSLLWRTRSNPRDRATLVSRRYKNYYAPTWSWASVTGPVEFITLPGRAHNFKLIPDLVIVEANCVASSANPFGPVKSAYLKISGSLIPLTGRTNPQEDVDNSTNRLSKPPHGRGFDCDVSDKGANEIVEGEPLWLLLIAHGERCGPGFSRLEGYHYLVLRESRLDPDSYERVGCLWGSGELWEGEFSQGAQKQTMTLL
ncbi:hypothetical protein GP486_000635 [Trichoglossum hirsutum]|uniref:Heterokaryon incompatibility domain-containing protein n=1 Tax=Trichoglossum hirsutum TaxID=265104 RepID=A0A9P8RTT0_9PEZI|nr:hypothetical protein GP486_000635 [Trichoglossum hirsutum]